MVLLDMCNDVGPSQRNCWNCRFDRGWSASFLGPSPSSSRIQTSAKHRSAAEGGAPNTDWGATVASSHRQRHNFGFHDARDPSASMCESLPRVRSCSSSMCWAVPERQIKLPRLGETQVPWERHQRLQRSNCGIQGNDLYRSLQCQSVS